MIASFVLNNNLRYEGKAFYAMIGLVTGGILNIFGDYLFVIVLGKGVLGAGLATAISQVVSFSILLYFYSKTAQSKIRLSAISKEVKVYVTISRVGFPAVIRHNFSHPLLKSYSFLLNSFSIQAISFIAIKFRPSKIRTAEKRFNSFIL